MKKTKPTIVLLMAIILFAQSYAQQVISTAGGYFQGDNLNMSWTLGEPVIETFSGNDVILTQGFQQPYNFYYTQILNIPEGWSGASVYLVPLNKGVENMYADHLNDFILQSSLTDIYYPAGNINTIGNWNYETGYQVKAENEFDLSIVGSKIADPVVQLQMGWNLIPVLSPCGANTSDVFGSMTNIEIVKEVAGIGVYWPQYGVNTLETLSPGKAYLVRMSAENSFTYPGCDKSTVKSKATIKPAYNTLWNQLNYAALSHVIAIPYAVIMQANIQSGDIIGVFTPEGICAGQAMVGNAEQNMALVAFADDEITAPKEGLTNGDLMQFKVYRSSSNEETELMVQFDSKLPNQEFFDGQGLSALKKITFTPSSHQDINKLSINIYPNPSQGVFTLTLNQWPQDMQIILDDTKGNRIAVYNPGPHADGTAYQINLSHLAKGIYYLKFIHSNSMQVKKIVIN